MANYTFICEKCRKEIEIEIPMAEYTEQKDKQVCKKCGSKLKRKIEWGGGVKLCAGMYGIDGSKGWAK